jgi:ferredoxin
LTAWLLLGYVFTAFVVDSFFKGASFCKYVCPIGQFNFVSSLLSPVELKTRNKNACLECSTHDCVRGNAQQRGCELQLYLPNKVGNFDCTLCMDCVKACPHDNIGLIVQSPIRELSRDPQRSSIGRLSSRLDMTMLLLVVTFSSIVNAGLMTAPISDFLGLWQSRYPLLGANAVSLFGCLILSGALLACVCGVARIMQSYSSERQLRRVLGRFALALLPLGLSMWAAHLLFHWVTASSSLLPALQQAWTDILSVPQASIFHNLMPMSMSSSMPMMNKPYDLILLHGAAGINLLTVQVWMLNLGLLLSFYAGWRTVRQISSTARNTIAMLSVWMLSSGCLYGGCIWVFTQPMEMRGMGM